MGVHSILNFAPCVLNVPDGVEVRKVDLATELQILAFHEQHTREEIDGIADLSPVVEEQKEATS